MPTKKNIKEITRQKTLGINGIIWQYTVLPMPKILTHFKWTYPNLNALSWLVLCR